MEVAQRCPSTRKRVQLPDTKGATALQHPLYPDGHVSRSSGLAKNILARHRTRRQKRRATERGMGGQHLRVDRPNAQWCPREGGQPRWVEEHGGEISIGVPIDMIIYKVSEQFLCIFFFYVSISYYLSGNKFCRLSLKFSLKKKIVFSLK